MMNYPATAPAVPQLTLPHSRSGQTLWLQVKICRRGSNLTNMLSLEWSVIPLEILDAALAWSRTNL